MTTALEIRLENLDNGPGLLPFKLGQAKLITHYHSFLQYIDLADLEHQVNSIRDQISYFRTKLENNTLDLYEIQLDHLSKKLIKVDSELKGLEPNRARRGLIDGLGSIIKSVTGNLDQSDAARYDNAIKILEGNEHKMLSEFNDHISLNKDWITQCTQIIASIAENQEKINRTLGLILDSNAYAETSLSKYAKFAQLLAIISENTDDLSLELNRIENILAFVRASSTHHSMLRIDNLEGMVNKLKTIYGKNEVLDDELREYYTIIKPGFYFVGKRLVFIFKFPIVSPKSFDFYKLSIVPNKLNQTFIPSYPFLATDGKAFMYMEAECPKFNLHRLCEESINHQPRDLHDCIQNLIIHQSLDTSCQPTKITLTKEAMEQLDDRHYTLVFPQPTRTRLQCGRQEFITLHGSYLATIPLKCSIQTNEFFITNTNDQIKGQPLKITEIPRNFTFKDNHSIPHLKLTTANLNGLHHLEDKILLQRPVDLKPTDGTFYHTTLPLYLSLFGAAVLVIIIVIRRHRKRSKLTIKKPSNERGQTPEHTYAVPAKSTPRETTPATFSLNVLK